MNRCRQNDLLKRLQMYAIALAVRLRSVMSSIVRTKSAIALKCCRLMSLAPMVVNPTKQPCQRDGQLANVKRPQIAYFHGVFIIRPWR
jgi:hypothetical protein